MKNAVRESSLPTLLFPTSPARDATCEIDTVLWIIWYWLMNTGLGEINEYWFCGAYLDLGTSTCLDFALDMFSLIISYAHICHIYVRMYCMSGLTISTIHQNSDPHKCNTKLVNLWQIFSDDLKNIINVHDLWRLAFFVTDLHHWISGL
jgi:hypothetical protein